MAFDWAALGLSAGKGLINSIGSLFGTEYSTEKQKELMDYQWDKMTSPQAQVKNLAAAGINPAVALGNQAPVFSSKGEIPSITPPDLGIGTTMLGDISSYINAKTSEKKAGSEIGKNESEIRVAEANAKAQEFQNFLNRVFGLGDRSVALQTAYSNLLLANDTHDINEQQKAINEWKKVSEQALAQANEKQRDILQLVLENKPKEIGLANKLQEEKIKSEQAGQAVSYASAEESRASARLKMSQNDFQVIENELKDSGKSFELMNRLKTWRKENMISDAEYEKALNMLNRYSHLNENDKNAAAEYLNYFLWYLKNEMPSLPIVPLLKLGK